MTQKDLFQTTTSSQQDTLVNPLVKQVSAKAKKTHVTSGRTSSKLLHPKDPLGLFSKTFMVTSAWDSIVSVIPTPPPQPETEDQVSWAQQLNDFLEDVTGLDLDGDGKVGGAPIPSPKAEQEPSVKSIV